MTVQVRSTTARKRRTALELAGKGIYQYGAAHKTHPGKYRVRVENGRDAQGKLQYKNYGPFPGTPEGLKEAIKARDEHLASLAKKAVKSLPVGRAAKAMTLATWAHHWKTVQIVNDTAASTADKYAASIDRYVLPHLGSYPLTGEGCLTKSRVELWREDLKAQGVQLPSINYALKRLKTCLAAAVAASKDTGLEVNPAIDVKAVDTGEKERTVSEYADYPKLLRAAGDHYLTAVIPVGLDSGLRASELGALHWRDAELDHVDAYGKPAPRLALRFHVTVQGSLKKGTMSQCLRPGTKTSKGKTEYVALSDNAVAALKAHRARLAEHKVGSKNWNKQAGTATAWFYGRTKNDACTPAHKRYVVPSDPIAPDALIFPSADGEPMSTLNLGAWFSRVAERAGVDKTIHGLRHDCGSFMLTAKNPVSLTAVSKHLRHKDPAFTARVYLHIIKERERDGANAMDALWAELGTAQAEAV